MQQYFLGLGSNIEPEQHFPQIIEALLQWSDRLDLSKIYRVEPMNMKSSNYFLNAVVRIQTDFNRSDLKAKLSALEIEMGRDRSDPNSKRKDRPADVDILLCLPLDFKQIDAKKLPDEVYSRQPLLELLRYLNFDISVPELDNLKQVVSLQWQHLTLGETEVSLQLD